MNGAKTTNHQGGLPDLTSGGSGSGQSTSPEAMFPSKIPQNCDTPPTNPPLPPCSSRNLLLKLHPTDKGKLVERRVRKATGLREKSYDSGVAKKVRGGAIALPESRFFATSLFLATRISGGHLPKG